MGDETPAERVSRFREHTNTNSSIRPPPDELWKDLGFEGLIDRFNDENDNTPAVRREGHPRRIMASQAESRADAHGADRQTADRHTAGRQTTDRHTAGRQTTDRHMAARKIAQPRTSTAAARKGSDAAATVATAEGTFGRFSRVFANVFGGVLGKRKAGHADAEPAAPSNPEQALLDERKRAAEEAYHVAKAQGLLPAPKVFVRPGMAPRAWSADTAAATPSRPRPPLTPRTPGSVARSPSKKDLTKQKKLSKRVSSLEIKLASAKKELASVLGTECFPAVPPLPLHLDSAARASSPDAPHVFSDDAAPLSPTAAFADSASASLPSKLIKKRKSVAVADDANADADFHPTAPALFSDGDMSDADPDLASPESGKQRSLKRVRSDASKRLKRTSSRLTRKVSRSSVKDDRDDEIVVVKPGGAVPPVPAVPSGVEGNKVRVEGDDGYGGLGHEIF